MAYQVISDFRLGMDRRKSRLSGIPGSLWTLQNALINRGGEIERAKKFVSTYALPASQTFGMAALGTALYVFGSVATPAVPAGVNYQRLQHPDGATAMIKVLSRDNAQGKLYVVAQFADGTVHHFYDGALVKDWDAGRVRGYMVDTTGIAAHLAVLINASGVNFTATALGPTVTVTNTTKNNDFAIALTATNGGTIDDQTLTSAVVTAASAGVSKVVDITVGGTFDPGDKFSLNFDTGSKQEFFGYAGTPDPIGTLAFAYKSKVYSPGGSLMNFSGVLHPEAWQRSSNTIPGAGFINVASQDGGSASITGVEIYEGNMAIFGELSVQVWNMSDDPASNALVQNLRNTGTRSPRSVKSYGSLDVFYLATSGIRSLRARTATSVAFASDMGSPIDQFVQAQVKTLSDAKIANAVSEIEPLDERYWLAVDGRLYVFSYFPSAEISAWGYVEPGFTVDDLARTRDQFFVRSGDTIYLYGGSDGQQYPGANEQIVLVETPFFDKQAVSTKASLEGFDFGATNTWDIWIATDPTNDQLLLGAGTVTGTTFRGEDFPIEDVTTHVAFRMQCSRAGNAKITNVSFGYEDYKAKPA